MIKRTKEVFVRVHLDGEESQVWHVSPVDYHAPLNTYRDSLFAAEIECKKKAKAFEKRKNVLRVEIKTIKEK